MTGKYCALHVSDKELESRSKSRRVMEIMIMNLIQIGDTENAYRERIPENLTESEAY